MKHKTNEYDLSGEYGIGYTSKGDEFWFDLEDYDKIKDYCWYLAGNGYFKARSLKYDQYTEDKIYLHRVVTDASKEVMIDHKRHEKGMPNYDNRKSNLRIANYSENGMNTVIPKNNTSGFKGVCFDKQSNKWLARLFLNGEFVYQKEFDTKEKAIEARKNAEEKYFGEWSYDNSMKEYDDLEKGA